MAEYDALPEIGRSVVANLICTTSIAAAIALEENGAIEAWRFRVVVGCPLKGGAKRVLVEKGVFDDMSAALIIHPRFNEYRFLTFVCSRRPSPIEYFGKPYAAADPAKGVNARSML